jgi:methionyl-tRNA formyltransferase
MLYNFWQGYTPWPGVWTYLNGKRCSITRCARVENSAPSFENKKPGSILLDKNRVFVYCIDGEAIEILEILIE